ncbi:hypothetical protein KIPB_011876 [Kipferlia bialata]|uniref:Uncharacterized protein n=1 Tax=Kipferlia bialata TaxID=797122 RepID=A0A391NQJ9_9EUKA|nr:hypothetical protein KIPB_011876 [Kipferlia bialata]|eukprot:g11876.t1
MRRMIRYMGKIPDNDPVKPLMELLHRDLLSRYSMEWLGTKPFPKKSRAVLAVETTLAPICHPNIAFREYDTEVWHEKWERLCKYADTGNAIEIESSEDEVVSDDNINLPEPVVVDSAAMAREREYQAWSTRQVYKSHLEKYEESAEFWGIPSHQNTFPTVYLCWKKLQRFNGSNAEAERIFNHASQALGERNTRQLSSTAQGRLLMKLEGRPSLTDYPGAAKMPPFTGGKRPPTAERQCMSQ